MREIGIYGGSFDPIHIGHAAMGSYVSQFGGVDEVWMLVSPLNPLKSGRIQMFTDEERLEMVRLAMRGCDRVRVSDFEMGLPRPSYTYRTLCALRDSFADCSFRLIVGADNLCNFNLWHNPGDILREFGLVVYPRPGVQVVPESVSETESVYAAPGSVRVLYDAPTMDISSTFLRQKLREGADLRFLIPPGAYEFLKERM